MAFVGFDPCLWFLVYETDLFVSFSVCRISRKPFLAMSLDYQIPTLTLQSMTVHAETGKGNLRFLLQSLDRALQITLLAKLASKTPPISPKRKIDLLPRY